MHDSEPQSAAQQAASENLYAPPKAVIADQARVAPAPEFYVVESGKFLMLYFGTLGFYHVYWFWKHWALQRDRHRLDLWPIPRALFNIFFAHALNARIAQRLAQRETTYVWSPGLWATVYVVCTIVSRMFDRLASMDIGWPTTSMLALAAIVPIGLSLLQTQRAANRACDDPEGAGNERLTLVNYVWLFLGALLWILLLLGLTVSPDEVA